MKNIFMMILLSSVSLNIQAMVCLDKSVVDLPVFKNISKFIVQHPVMDNILSSDQIRIGQKFKTKENEYLTIIFISPYRVKFQIHPESEIEILSNSDQTCGPQIKLNRGKILSTGNHPEVSDTFDEKCAFEIETAEAYIQPTGTSYLVESGALGDAIAELNGESRNQNNLVQVGQTGTIEESYFENYLVKKGTIKIKLKRLSKNKLKNIIRYTKKTDSKKNKSNRKLAKNTKNKGKKRFLAYNEKIKLKAGVSLSVKRKKSSKKTQTAELQIIEPPES